MRKGCLYSALGFGASGPRRTPIHRNTSNKRLFSDGNQRVNEVRAMSKINIAGIVCLVAGFVVFGFQAIQTLMDPSATDLKKQSLSLKKITIVGLAGKENLEWINSISWESVQNLLNKAVTMPLWILLVGIGIFCLILGVVASKE